jgi:hypothetical protein
MQPNSPEDDVEPFEVTSRDAKTTHAQNLLAEIAEARVNDALWQRDCETRAVWGK